MLCQESHAISAGRAGGGVLRRGELRLLIDEARPRVVALDLSAVFDVE